MNLPKNWPVLGKKTALRLVLQLLKTETEPEKSNPVFWRSPLVKCGLKLNTARGCFQDCHADIFVLSAPPQQLMPTKNDLRGRKAIREIVIAIESTQQFPVATTPMFIGRHYFFSSALGWHRPESTAYKSHWDQPASARKYRRTRFFALKPHIQGR